MTLYKRRRKRRRRRRRRRVRRSVHCMTGNMLSLHSKLLIISYLLVTNTCLSGNMLSLYSSWYACQKRPTLVSKETYISVKRDLSGNMLSLYSSWYAEAHRLPS